MIRRGPLIALRVLLGLGVVVAIGLCYPVSAAERPPSQHTRMERALERIEAKVDQLLGAAPPPKPAEPVPVQPPPAPPVATPAPAPPAAANPFVAWRAAGHDLVHIQSWILGRGLTPEEEKQAREAGYFDAPAPQPAGGGGSTTSLEGRALGWSNGRWLWLPSASGGPSGTVACYDIGPVPPGYVGGFKVSIGATSQQLGSDHSPEFDYWLERGGAALTSPRRTANANGVLQVMRADPGTSYRACARNVGSGRATIQLNHS